MDRNLKALSEQSFDLLVVGGGIHGACVAWEATLRGLSVALVEKSDFCSATSANSLKVIHGGLRYLQTADIKRMRQSIRARKTLMQIAPHLVHPLPVLIPTYGHGLKGREAMAVALKINDWVSCDRNHTLSDPQKHIPPGYLLSREDCLKKLPDLPTQNLTGAAQFQDAQVYNSERLVLTFLQSAMQRGAQMANYVKVTDFLKQGQRVYGATVQDQLTGDVFAIQAKTIVNTSGPWIHGLIEAAKNIPTGPHPLAKAMNLVVRPVFSEKMDSAVGLASHRQSLSSSPSPSKSSRLFFIAPWRNTSLVGTWYAPYSGHPDDFQVTEAEIQQFLDEINTIYPTLKITPADILKVHAGLLPSSGVSATGEVQLSKQFQLTDHRSEGLEGLLSVTGVKYTTAQDIAVRAVDRVFRHQGKPSPPSTSHKTALLGGQIESFDDFMQSAQQTYHEQISQHDLQQLICNYGSLYPKVLAHLPTAMQSAQTQIETRHLLSAEIHYHLNNTMPQTLNDMVFRRTELGSTGHPGTHILKTCTEVMGLALGWNLAQQQQELKVTEQSFNRYLNQSQQSQAFPVSSPVSV